jgi:CBS domain-containing protein
MEDAMLVRDAMRRYPRVASPTQNLILASQTMKTVDCGVLPVVDKDGKLVGIVTDRDVCLSLAKHDRTPERILVEDVMSVPVHASRPEETIAAALETMCTNSVRRLPVLDDSGDLVGLLSLDDIAIQAKELVGNEPNIPSFAEVADTLRAVNRHQVPSIIT